MKIAAIGDFHCRIDSEGMIRKLLAGVEQAADVLVMAGDLTNRGRPKEMERLLDELRAVSIPKIAVVGNHDHESDHTDLLVQMMEAKDICVLDSSTCEIDGIGFVGTKGFCGGFADRRLKVFGEKSLKTFIQTSIEEAIRLENALSELETERKVAILRYAPVKETLAGEDPELFAFLGTSRLADALERFGVDVIFHGHAHHGAPAGKTATEIPVYNVARFVMEKESSRPYRVYEI